MPTLAQTVDGFLSAREYDNATIGRCAFWVEQLGSREPADISPDEVDAAVVALATRGRLRAGRGLAAERTGKPVAGASLNLRWADIDLAARTATVLVTKTGRPQVSALSERAVALLSKLPGEDPDALVFAGRRGHPYTINRLWDRIC